jgi:predicted transcriptional regulator
MYCYSVLRPAQCRAARALLGISQRELALRAGVTQLVLNRFERGKSDPRASTLEKIENALIAAGVEFSETGGLGVKLRQ